MRSETRASNLHRLPSKTANYWTRSMRVLLLEVSLMLQVIHSASTSQCSKCYCLCIYLANTAANVKTGHEAVRKKSSSTTANMWQVLHKSRYLTCRAA